MTKLSFDDGVEVWFANYYDTKSSSFNDLDIHAFGHYAAAAINKNREEICLKIEEKLTSGLLGKIFGQQGGELGKNCFGTDDIKYDEERRYIKFPDFVNLNLQDFVMRIDINPCVASSTKQTKIYCIPKYRGTLNDSTMQDFFRFSVEVSDAIVQLISKYYIEAFNQYVEINKPNGVVKLSDEVMSAPFRVVSFFAGSTSEEMTAYIDLSEYADDFAEFWSLSEGAQNITSFLSMTAESFGLPLQQFDWVKRSTWLPDPDTNITSKCVGYIGVYTNIDNANAYLIGVSNCRPAKVFMPVHIDMINAN